MSTDVRNRAEQRLAEAAAAGGFADPRPPLRERLRLLREEHAAAFEEARRHYEQEVLPALAGETSALATWIEYGRWLAARTAPGRVLGVDAAGAAAPYAPPPAAGTLMLHVPDDTSAPVLVLAAPADPTPAQQATLDLLVHRKLSLP